MKNIAVTLVILLSSLFSVRAQENIEEGKTIFKSRCTSCHAVDKRLIGPALKDVDQRHEEKWIIDFVHSSQTVINNGDEAAVKLFNEYNQAIMPDHKDLSEAQIKNIIAYIKDEGAKAPAKSSKRPTVEYTKPYTDKNSFIDKVVYLNLDEAQTPIKFSDTSSWLVIGSIIVLLVTILYLITYLQYYKDLFAAKRKKAAEEAKKNS